MTTGLCECGCGQQTKPFKQTNTAMGQRKGEFRRFAAPGHNRFIPLEQKYDVDLVTGCWNWNRRVCKAGYGMANRRGTGNPPIMAHRLLYEIHVGMIPEGLEIDHLCRNRRCVNPAHLEPVTREENIRRGVEARQREKAAAAR